MKIRDLLSIYGSSSPFWADLALLKFDDSRRRQELTEALRETDHFPSILYIIKSQRQSEVTDYRYNSCYCCCCVGNLYGINLQVSVLAIFYRYLVKK